MLLRTRLVGHADAAFTLISLATNEDKKIKNKELKPCPRSLVVAVSSTLVTPKVAAVQIEINVGLYK